VNVQTGDPLDDHLHRTTPIQLALGVPP
jgi:hypothetical protein